MSTIKANSWKTLQDQPVQAFAQIVTAQKTDPGYIATTAWTDVTGLSVTITPRKATSRILILLKLNYNSYGHGAYRILRNGNLIAAGDQAGSSRLRGFGTDYGSSSFNTTGYDCRQHGGEWIDFPNTTSATTYKVQMRVDGYVAINYNSFSDSDDTWNYRVPSCITTVEILE